MADYRFVTYETLDDGSIARILLNRPETRNAQSRGLLVDLNAAFMEAEADDAVRVVILGGAGKMFSSGHDMGSAEAMEEYLPGPNQHPTAASNGGTRLGVEKRMLQEWHYFFENTLRWRNLRKITIAQMTGTVYAAGLMLMWACDLITAADDVRFADVVGTRLGMCGVEYFAHPWEFGPRKTKELMLTGDSIDVEEAHRLGMVSKIFPAADLPDRTLDYARRIAKLPTVTALLIKESVNQTVDNMGFYNGLQACFNLHQLNHAHWAEVTHGERPVGTPEFGVPDWKDAPPVRLAEKDTVGGMKFGLPFFGISPRYYGEVARAAEQAGFESVWIPEHLVLPVDIPPTYLYSDSGFPPITADTPMYDPWVVLAAVSGVTSTIRLATNVFILPLRHPIATARSVVTLDRISGGRVTLGIGVGWLEQEFDVMGQSFHDRGRRTDEIIDLLRRLWSDDVIEQHTEHFDFGPIKFQPKPLQKPSIPIEVGGTSVAALRRAGRLGDGWVEIGAKSIDDLRASLAVVNEVRRAAGRDGLPFEVTSGFGGDIDSVRRCMDLGVTRVMTGPRATGARITKDDVIEWTKRFADEVIAKV